MNLNKLKEQVYKNALAHGWHDEKHSDAHWLCLVIAELMEAVEADRMGKRADRHQFENYMSLRERSDDEFIYAFKHGIKDTVEDELADACIRLLDFAGTKSMNIDYMNAGAIITEDYSDRTFTESIFRIVKKVTAFNCNGALLSILAEIFALCHTCNIDIEWHIRQKMRYNRHRPYRHGNKKY